MQTGTPAEITKQAIERLESMRDQQSGGKWLETLTAAAGPYIKEWDIAQCWTWTEWPDRDIEFAGSTNQDIGIDVVAVRRIDGRHIAIQCKSRRLENGTPVAIQKSELDSFANASSNPFWAERWLVANGEAPFSPQAEQALSMAGVDRPIKPVNIHADLLSQTGGQDEKPYGDAAEIEPADLERFQELADRWEKETVLLSDSDQAANHPAHQEIVNFGTPVVPLILERMRTQGGHWFRALHDITDADPVKPTDRGNVLAMEEAWLNWGADNGYV